MRGYARDRIRQGFLLRLIPMAVLAGCGTIAAKRDGSPAAPLGENTGRASRHGEQPLSPYGNPDSYVVNGKRYHTLKTSRGFMETGVASWYGSDFHGEHTSSGEIYDMYQMTAAHTRLPLPTYVKVTNLFNERSAVVKVNDRGPFFPERVIDLSYAAALKLDIAGEGTGVVKIQALDHENEPIVRRELRIPPEARQGQKAMFLQVGAFENWANAERLRIEVSRVLKRAAHIQKTLIAKRFFYRVHIGPFQNAELADSVTPTLSRMGLRVYRLVSN